MIHAKCNSIWETNRASGAAAPYKPVTVPAEQVSATSTAASSASPTATAFKTSMAVKCESASGNFLCSRAAAEKVPVEKPKEVAVKPKEDKQPDSGEILTGCGVNHAGDAGQHPATCVVSLLAISTSSMGHI